MDNHHRLELQVFVQPDCDLCDRARQLARDVEGDYSQLAVRVTDIAQPGTRRDDVFAVPTFLLDGQVFSLGNPEPEELRMEIERLLKHWHSV